MPRCYVLLLLLVTVTCHGDIKEVDDELVPSNVTKKRVTYPGECTDSCSYLMTWKRKLVDGQNVAKVEVKLTGKPTEYSITDTSKMWIAFGFSEYGTMANSDIYLCLKIDEVYSTTKVNGYSHGITASDYVVALDGGTVVGSFNDGVFSCSYDIKNSDLSTKLQPMFYGMGPADDKGNVAQHYKDPRTTTQKFSLVDLVEEEVVNSASTIIAGTLLIGAAGLLALLV